MEIATFNPIQAPELPDFRAKLDPRRLASAAIEAVHLVKPGSSTFQNKAQVFSESMLLTVLAYCYAVGIYASSDVEEAIQEDETVRYLCARAFPDSEDLRQFRRRKAAEIKKCLIQLLSILNHRFDPSPDGPFTCGVGKISTPDPGPEFVEEAERRITRAIQADSVALDL